jgi:hypothetical protein
MRERALLLVRTHYQKKPGYLPGFLPLKCLPGGHKVFGTGTMGVSPQFFLNLNLIINRRYFLRYGFLIYYISQGAHLELLDSKIHHILTHKFKI